MCGRFTLKTPAKELASLPDLPPRYNIAPTQDVLCVRCPPNAGPEAASLRWGLIPCGAKDAAIRNKPINVRTDIMAEKPACRSAY